MIKTKLNDRDKAEILYEQIVVLERENECLKTRLEIKRRIQTLN